MTEPVPDPRSAVLRKASAVGLVLVLMAVQFSIGVAHALFALTLIGWIALLIVERRRPQAPRFAIPLGLYAVLTLVSAILSTDPTTSVIDSRQLFLFLLVPMTYDLITSEWADNAATAVLSAGAVSGLVGIGQYAILNYNLDQRPHGTLGMYMTYSGLTMLIVCLAVAQVLFARNGRTWAALVVPALAVALAVTFTRNTWIGACSAVAVLFLMKDFRLLVILPVVAAVFFARRAGRHPAAVRVDLRSARSQQSRSPGDGRGRRPYRSRPPVDRRRSGHGAARLPALPHGGRRARDAAPSPQRPGAGRRRARTPCAGGVVLVRGRRGARPEASVRLVAAAGGGCQPPAWPRSSRCSPPACSSTTSAIPSS